MARIYGVKELMRQMIIFLLLFSLSSTLGIGIVLGKCIYIYTDSFWCQFIFQLGFSFLSSLFVSHFIVQNYVRVLWSVK